MKATITRALLQGLPPPAEGEAKLRVFDDRLPGFIAERRRSAVTFYLRYTDERRRSREVKLGRLGDVTVDQARRAAERIRSQVSLGRTRWPSGTGGARCRRWRRSTATGTCPTCRSA